MSKSMSRMLLFVGIFFALLFGWYGIKKIFIMVMMSNYTMPPITVSSVVATEKNWRSYVESVGSLSAVNGVELSTEASGIVRFIHINSGQNVKKGDLIIELDTRLQKAALKDKAAQLKLTQIDYEREKKLYEKRVTAQSTLDKSLAALQKAEAAYEIVNAEIDQKTIEAPFDGRVGIRQVNLGQYVSPGTPMVSLQALSPLFVDFNLPEQYVKDLYIKQPIEIIVNNIEKTPISGMITAINSKVDQVTRNILVQATIPNNAHLLYPGMYALVRIWLQDTGRKIVIPQSAISYSLSGDYVFLIKKDGDKKDSPLRTRRQYIKVGERRGNEAVILSGLKAGDVIVSSGQLKLRNESHVVINNKLEL